MTNVPDPDDHTVGERVDDSPTTDPHLDAAIREFDRLRHSEAWSSTTASGDVGHAAQAETDDTAEEPAPSLVDQAEAVPGETINRDDNDEDLFAPEPTGTTPGRGYRTDPIVEPENLIAPDDEFRRGNLSDFDDGTNEEATLDDAGPGTEDRLPPAGNLSWPSAGSATPSLGDEPIAQAAMDAAPEPSSLPRRMFGLKRALDAHRLGVPADALPSETRTDEAEGVEDPVEHVAEPAIEQFSERASEMPDAGVDESGAVKQQDAERAAWLGAWRAAPSEPDVKISEAARIPRTSAPVTPEPARAAEPEAQAERRGWFGARRSAEPEIKMQPADRTSEAIAMASAAAGAAAAAVAEKPRKGWFGSRRSAAAGSEAAAPEPTVTAPEPKAAEPVQAAPPVAADAAPDAKSAADPFAAMKEAIAPKPRRERKGWFGSRPAPAESIAQATTPPPDKVDLEPVREAMQAAALKRAEVSAGGIGIPTAAVGLADDAPAALSADASRVGVLLVNLGTPDAPTPRAVRRYLRQFLSDRRVIERDTFVWQLVLKGIILPLRPRSKARAYKSIWNREKNESPLKTVTRAQAEKLGATLTDAGADTVVDWAMRYGNPSIGSRIRALLTQGCERILIVPLYPQYSSATTATVCDEVFRVVSRLRNQPSLRIAPPYYADPVYIEAVASSIRAELAKLAFEPEVIIASYHGMPLEYVQKGDPYLRQCTRTTELLRERLGKSQSNFVMTFQSRFGRAEWLQPYTNETLRKLAKDGVKSVAVVTPGFAADCLETLEEIAIENAHIFKKKGGKNFAFVPCLNDTERGMLVIREIAGRELKGWV